MNQTETEAIAYPIVCIRNIQTYHACKLKQDTSSCFGLDLLDTFKIAISLKPNSLGTFTILAFKLQHIYTAAAMRSYSKVYSQKQKTHITTSKLPARRSLNGFVEAKHNFFAASLRSESISACCSCF